MIPPPFPTFRTFIKKSSVLVRGGFPYIPADPEMDESPGNRTSCGDGEETPPPLSSS